MIILLSIVYCMDLGVIFLPILLIISKVVTEPPLDDYSLKVGTAPSSDVQGVNYSKRRWYIDIDTATCKTFQYLGSGGNMNNFATQSECENHLIFTPEEQIYACALPMNEGLCGVPDDKKLNRWYFKRVTVAGVSTGTCELFKYKGCGGNANNFHTKPDCLKACQNDRIPDVSANAPQNIPQAEQHPLPNDFDCLIREEIDTADPVVKIVANPQQSNCIYATVKKSAYRGYFTSFQQCVNICIPKEKQIEACKRGGPDQLPGTGVIERANPIKERFYYDKISKTCKLFHSFANFDGSSDFDITKNRFPTLELCLSYCPAINQNQVTEAIDVCNLPMAGEESAGSLINGILSTKRYFYNSAKRQPACESFTYGGLNGNYNNFDTEANCKAMCETPLAP